MTSLRDLIRSDLDKNADNIAQHKGLSLASCDTHTHTHTCTFSLSLSLSLIRRGHAVLKKRMKEAEADKKRAEEIVEQLRAGAVRAQESLDAKVLVLPWS